MRKNNSNLIQEAIAQMKAFGSGGSSGETDHSRSTLFWTDKGAAKPKKEFKPNISLSVRQRTTREAPKQNIEVNKAAESLLVREDVLDDGFDHNMVTQSVQPNKSSLDANNVKEECDKSDIKSECNPAITAEGGVTAAIKQKTKVNKEDAAALCARGGFLYDSELGDGPSKIATTGKPKSVAYSETESELDVSCNDSCVEDKASTPRKQDRGKKLSKETKEIKERKIAEEKARKEQLRREKEEEKKKRTEERVAEMKNKEEEKKRKEAEKKNNYDARIDFLERSLRLLADRVEQLECQTRKTPSNSDDQHSLTYIIAFPPFKMGKNMKLAPTVRTEFDDARKGYLDQILLQSDSEPTIGLNPRYYRETIGKSCGATWPLGNNNDAGVIDEGEAGAPINNEDIVTIAHAVPRKMRPKLLNFHENRRPAYWGTWRKSGHSVGPRRPFDKETIFDYDVDSDDEWEEEVEPADESSTDSECEAEEINSADHYEVDDGFVVPDGYLSGDEFPNSKNVKAKTSAAQEPYRVLEIKPTLISRDYSSFNKNNFSVLQRYAAEEFCDSLPIKTVSSELNCENGESPMADEAVVLFSSTPKKVFSKELNCEKGESSMADGVTRSGNKSSKRLVSDSDVPALIRMLHGTSRTKFKIAEDFLLQLEPNRAEESKNGPSQSQIFSKINEIASWSKCTEAGAVNGKRCWIVKPDVLDRYSLAGLSANKNLEPKKRGHKTDDSRSEEDTPPAKIPRVSLLSKLV